jgi:glyoxylase-like metal-dependent hydrolase (beta-lactamase superfamily II)
MSPAEEFQTVRPGLYFWQEYDPAVKTDVCCCAFETPEGLVFCDPVPLAAEALAELTAGRQPCGILLTSANHERNAVALARRLGIDIWADVRVRGDLPATRWFRDGETVLGAQAIALDGFALGETAFWKDGLLIFGDAVIHVPPYGLAMLPEKYCEDPAAGRTSLKRLLGLPAEIVVFAHGLPVVARARERLAELIG